MPTICIVVLVSNVEKHLREALHPSLTRHHDLQIIRVDDGSTDGSSAILHEAAVITPRVEMYIQVNFLCTKRHMTWGHSFSHLLLITYSRTNDTAHSSVTDLHHP